MNNKRIPDDGQNSDERLREQALRLLDDPWGALAFWVRVAMTQHAMDHVTTTTDDAAPMLLFVRDPNEVDPQWQWAIPQALVRTGILRDSGRTVRSTRPEGRSRTIQVWELDNREAAEEFIHEQNMIFEISLEIMHERDPGGFDTFFGTA
jgi:hypothetical protein